MGGMQLERIKTAVKLCSYSHVRRQCFLRARLRAQFANVLAVFTARVRLLVIDGRGRIFGFGTSKIRCSVSSSLIYTFCVEASSRC